MLMSTMTLRITRALTGNCLCVATPPVAEAYQATFSISPRLLERATHLREELGGGSLTALPLSKRKRRISPLIFRPT